MKLEFSIKISEEFLHPTMQDYKEILEFVENIAKRYKEELGALVNVDLNFKEAKDD
ncbi:hypothetical protein LCGC14_1947980 [marine sediment metagenome]|uniref:Uncharacterized protein n=1 Tax=marine sediment metagenome TaxID=412755 RepID=A0A0F9HT59_9ZZZZ